MDIATRMLLMDGGKFAPSSLFKANEQGVWYDPSDIKLNWRRNLLTYSEQFDNTIWTKNGLKAFGSGSVVNTTATLDPFGANNAEFIVEDTSTGQHLIYYTFTTNVSTTFTVSIYLKYAGRKYVGLRVDNGAIPYAAIDLQTGSVVAGSGVTVTDSGNGWWRISTTKSIAAVAQYITVDFLSGASYSNFSYTGDGTSGVYIYGAQVEVGSTISTYQKITDAVADYYTYQPLPILYQDSAGTIPVTAVEQPVGLMLDKSKGLVLGSELVDTLNTAAAWGVYGTNTVVDDSGAVKITYVDNASGAYAYFAQVNGLSQNLVVGKRYVVSGEAKVSSGSVNVTVPVTVGGTATVTNTSYTSFSIQFICTNVSGDFLRADSMGAGEVIWLRNISVRELPGNHAYQATSANRPTLSARYNLLKYSEDFSNAAWNKAGCGVSTNSTTAPDGLQTADKITENTSTGTHEISSFIFASANIPLNLKVFIKRSSGTRNIRLTVYAGEDGFRAFINIDTLSVTNESFGAATYTSGSVTHVGDGWYLCSITGSIPNANPSFVFSMINTGGSTSYTGDGTSGLYFWGADLRPSNHGTDLPPYQRVTADTDYDTVGFPPYLAFNGTNSSMVTNSIDFSATDKMSVWAGVRKFSDTALGVISELSAVFSENNGAFGFGINDPSSNFFSGARGTIPSYDTSKNPATSPGTYVTMVKIGISNDVDVIRKNGADGLNEGSDLGTGNFGNYPLYIGARNQSQYFFNGNIYSLIIRGAQSTDKQVSNAESWINKKIGKVY